MSKKSETIKHTQKILKLLGYTVEVSGKYDFRTGVSIRQFQRDYNLAVDGIIGHQTLLKLAFAIFQEDVPKPETKNFSYYDSILDSDLYAKAIGIPYYFWDDMQRLFDALELVQDKLGVVLGYDCIYRSPEYEKANRITSKYQTHTKACAIDCYDISGNMTVYELADAIYKDDELRQLFGGMGLGGRKILHLDVYRRNKGKNPTIWWYTYKNWRTWERYSDMIKTA